MRSARSRTRASATTLVRPHSAHLRAYIQMRIEPGATGFRVRSRSGFAFDLGTHIQISGSVDHSGCDLWSPRTSRAGPKQPSRSLLACLTLPVRPGVVCQLPAAHNDSTASRADLKLYKEVVGHMNGAKYSSLYL